MYTLDPSSTIPLHQQLYQEIKDDIQAHYQAGDKLPSIRKVANEHNISKTTVESAYAQLYAEGYIESRPKSGYYVCEVYFDTFNTKEDTPLPQSPSHTHYLYDFFPAQLCSVDFPLKTWKRIATKVLDETIDFGAYPKGQGELVLREQIAKYLRDSRAVECDVSQIVITSGFIDSMRLIATLLKDRYTHFGIEQPGYHIARKVFSSYGYHVEYISVNDKGVNLASLNDSKAQILYITPLSSIPYRGEHPHFTQKKAPSHDVPKRGHHHRR